jgi:hypothetical protein
MNPLFNALFGSRMPQIPSAGQQMNVQGMDWNALMGQLQANPGDALKTAGYNVPDELVNNPQATVMHLLQTGQVSNPLMQRIQPFLNHMGVK